MLEVNGKKYYHVFTAGSYPQASVTPEMLGEIARSYDIRFREAPVWRGHPEEIEDQRGNNEPEALGWIDSVIAREDKLYVSFSYLSEELKKLIEDKRFRYVSVEIVRYAIDGKTFPYLYAVGLTNRPMVKGLEPLEFQNQQYSCDFANRIFFTLKNFNSITMTEKLIAIAKTLNLDVTKFTTDESLQAAIEKTYTDSAAKVTTLEAKVRELEGKLTAAGSGTEDAAKLTELQTQITALQNEKVETLIESAISSGKILPADKDKFTKLAKADYTATKEVIAAMAVRPELAKSMVKDGAINGDVNLTDPKFTNEKGEKLTYADITKKPSLVAKHKLTPEDVAALKEAS
jgi:phage I-like protein